MRVEEFVRQLERAGGIAHVTSGADQIRETVAGVLRDLGARRVGVSDARDLAELAQSLRSSVEVRVTAETEPLLECDAGISTAQLGIAETGTLVLASSHERHRLVSLLPEAHVAVLPASAIVDTLDDAFAGLADPDTGLPPRAVTFITGPSRTADIELTLVIGVHGPRALHVVVDAGA